MNRATVVFLAAFEAVITAAIGIGVALAPLTIVWAVQYHMNADWLVFWRASGLSWLVGHGVDLGVHIDAQSATALGLPGAVPPFAVTAAALGIALFSLAMGARIGWRAAETDYPVTGFLSATIAFGLVAQAVAAGVTNDTVAVNLWQAGLVPAAVLAAGVLLGLGLRRARTAPGGLSRLMRAIPGALRDIAGASMRAAVSSVALIIGASAIVVSILLIAHFGRVVSLYEALQSGYLGGTTLTLAQLAVLPNAVVWAASYLLGPGFAVGLGTSVAPSGVQLGPLPGIPLLGVLPEHVSGLAYLGALVPLAAAFLSGYLTHARSSGDQDELGRPSRIAAVAAGSAVLAGAMLGLAAWMSGGAIAPGALAHLGPDLFAVALAAFAEVGIGSAAGMFAARYSRASASPMVPSSPEVPASPPSSRAHDLV